MDLKVNWKSSGNFSNHMRRIIFHLLHKINVFKYFQTSSQIEIAYRSGDETEKRLRTEAFGRMQRRALRRTSRVKSRDNSVRSVPDHLRYGQAHDNTCADSHNYRHTGNRVDRARLDGKRHRERGKKGECVYPLTVLRPTVPRNKNGRCVDEGPTTVRHTEEADRH